jgi:ribosomal protein S1
MNKGIQITIDDSLIKKRLENLEPSRYTSKLNNITREITSKYAEEIGGHVQSRFGHGRVISGLHKKIFSSINGNIQIGYISENYIARWLDEGTTDRYTKGRVKTGKFTKTGREKYRVVSSLKKYRGKIVSSQGVFTGLIARYKPVIYADYEKRVSDMLIEAWNKV